MFEPPQLRSAIRLLRLLLVVSVSAVAFGGTEPTAAAWVGVSLGRVGGTAVSEAGARVSAVVKDSPADRAGLRGSDLILAVDGRPVADNRELVEAITAHAPGEWVELRVERKGEQRRFSVRLEARPERKILSRTKMPWAGIEPLDVPLQLREFWGGGEDTGVLVGAVESGSPADIAGLLPGDLVLEADGEPVGDARALVTRIREGGVGNEVELRISRQGTLLDVDVPLEERPEDAESF